jgi:hypothetical protein
LGRLAAPFWEREFWSGWLWRVPHCGRVWGGWRPHLGPIALKTAATTIRNSSNRARAASTGAPMITLYLRSLFICDHIYVQQDCTNWKTEIRAWGSSSNQNRLF